MLLFNYLLKQFELGGVVLNMSRVFEVTLIPEFFFYYRFNFFSFFFVGCAT